MASLVHDLKNTGFDARPSERLASYSRSVAYGQLTVSLTENELVSEFGLVPETLRVVILVEEDVAADAWMEAEEKTRHEAEASARASRR